MVPKLFWLTAPLNISLSIHGTPIFHFLLSTSFVMFVLYAIWFNLVICWIGYNCFYYRNYIEKVRFISFLFYIQMNHVSANTYAHIPAEIMVPQVLVCHPEYLISGSMVVQFFAKWKGLCKFVLIHLSHVSDQLAKATSISGLVYLNEVNERTVVDATPWINCKL